MTQLDRYVDEFDGTEAVVYGEMQEFRAPDDGWFSTVKERVDEPLERLAKKMGEAVGREQFDKVVAAVVDQLNDMSAWSLQPDEVLESYREAGHPVEEIAAIASLDLGTVETVVEGLGSKYRMAALGEGAVSGAAGLPGAVANLPVIAATAMRAVAEYAIHYGFPVRDPDQRHALLVLAASASSGEARTAALEEVSAFAEHLHGRRVPDQEVPAPAAREIGERLVLQLGRGAIAQSLPVIGAAIGGGMDRQFLESVCETAHHAYRERWLLRAHADGAAA